jgi:hypothetical protein
MFFTSSLASCTFDHDASCLMRVDDVRRALIRPSDKQSFSFFRRAFLQGD